jgi:chorismate mutase
MAEERELKGAPKPASPPRTEGEIDGLRKRIDVIDEQLLRLVNSRSACAVEIGKVKRALGLPVYSPEREAWILERITRENPGPLDAGGVRRVFERIIDESRRLERLAADEDGEPKGE